MCVRDCKITIAQLNPVSGDVAGNVDKISEIYLDAAERGRDLLVTPELSVSGYPIGDLANDAGFLNMVESGLAALKRVTAGRRTALMVGAPCRDKNGVHNAVLVFRDGGIVKGIRKKSLPRYGVFDEMRNFVPDAGVQLPFSLDGVKVGVLLCDDAWGPEAAMELRDNGAQIIVSVNASPFCSGGLYARVTGIVAERVRATGVPMLYVNMIGGQDESVFDGGSFLVDENGERLFQMPQWEECTMDLAWGGEVVGDYPDRMGNKYRAMMQGLADYVRKSGFTDVMLGLSGGLDSALVAAVAGDALGAEHVHCFRLPSRYTTDMSNDAAESMCRTWGFPMETLPIEPVVRAAAEVVLPLAPDGLKSLTEENMQARARGYLLMTISNDRGHLLLSTGNKSEIAVGYATLYGDMCGAYNPLKDVFKTTAYSIAEWRNNNRPEGLLGPAGAVIPQEILDRPPSAELRPDQKDSDSLPPYPVLDGILEEMLEQRMPARDIIAKGFDEAVVERVARMVKNAEYKRRQGCPGPMTSYHPFLRNRHLPIVNGFGAFSKIGD
jgi:NAD+ synthetase